MPLIILRLLLTLFFTFFIGDLALCAFTRGAKSFHPLERLAIAFPIGLAQVVLMIFLMGLLHIPINFISLWSVVIFASAVLLAVDVYFYRYSFGAFLPLFRFPAVSGSGLAGALEAVLFFYILTKFGLIFFETLIKPIVDVDAIANYSVVAKGIFFDGIFNSPYLLSFFADKPPFAFLSLSWIPIGIGQWNDCLAKIIYPMLYVCFTSVIYFSIRRSASRLFSLFFAFLFVTLPFVFHHAQTAYADFSQMVYYAVGTIYLFLYMKDFGSDEGIGNPYLITSVLFLGFSAWVKRAGLFLLAIDVIVFLAFLFMKRAKLSKPVLKHLMYCALVLAMIVVPWLAYGKLQTALFSLSAISQGGGGATEPGFIDRTSVIISVTLTKLFMYADWSLLWALFLIVLPLCPGVFWKGTNPYLLAIVLLNILALFVQFRSGGSFTWLLDGTLFDRLVMAQIPVVLFFISQALTMCGEGSAPPAKPREVREKSGKAKKGR